MAPQEKLLEIAGESEHEEAEEVKRLILNWDTEGSNN